MQQLRVVDLQQHPSYLPSQVRVHRLDEWEQTFTCGKVCHENPSGIPVEDGHWHLGQWFSVAPPTPPPLLQTHGFLTQHLLLFLGGCCSQHGGGQRLLPLHVDRRLGCLGTRRGGRLTHGKDSDSGHESPTQVYGVKEMEAVVLAVGELTSILADREVESGVRKKTTTN